MKFRTEKYPSFTVYLGARMYRVDFIEGEAEVAHAQHIKALREFAAANPEYEIVQVDGEAPEEEPSKEEAPEEPQKAKGLF